MTCESCIHYKFGNITDYSTIKFHGLELSLYDLKMKILQAKRMNVSPLQIINAQNKKAFVNDSEMIPRNTSVIVKRLPLSNSNDSLVNTLTNKKFKVEKDSKIQDKSMVPIIEGSDLTKIDLPENTVIEEMMNQSSNVLGQKVGDHKIQIPLRCFKCNQIGHSKDRCPLLHKSKSFEMQKKRPKGIPSTMLEIVPKESLNNTNSHQGIYVDRKGDYVIPIVDKLAMEKKQPLISNSEFQPKDCKDFIPNEMKCKLCFGIFRDAVVIQCCGNSFCDECIRNSLLENNFHCPLPECSKSEILPDHLVPNQQLRKSVKRYLANIVDEKYNSNSNQDQSNSMFKKESDLKFIHNGSNKVALSKEDTITQSISSLPLPILFNSHNLFISSFQCNSDMNSNVETPSSSTKAMPPTEDTPPYPLLTKSEFYRQQSVFRKRYLSKQLPYDSKTDNSRQRFNSSDPQVKSEKRSKDTSGKTKPKPIFSKKIHSKAYDSAPNSITSLEDVSLLNELDCSNDEIFNDALCSLKDGHYELGESQDSNLNSKKCIHYDFHVVPQQSILKDNSGSFTKRNLIPSLKSSHAATNDFYSSIDEPDFLHQANVKDIPIYQCSSCDNSIKYHTSALMDVSDGEILDELSDCVIRPELGNHSKSLEIHNSEFYHNFSRSRLQSTVKKISHDSILSENVKNQLAKEESTPFFPPKLQKSHSCGNTKTDSSSSEIEEGQIVTNLGLNFPSLNVEKGIERNEDDFIIDQRFNLKFRRKTMHSYTNPDRIVMLKAPDKQNLNSRIDGKVSQDYINSISRSRKLTRKNYLFPRNKSHLLMTRTKDRRIVEIKTRRNNDNSLNEIIPMLKYSRERKKI